MQKKAITIGVVACVLALVIGGLCLAQPPQGGRQGQRGGGDQGGPGQQRGQFDPAQMQQRMMENWKQELGADDEAMKVIWPRINKVMELNRDSMAMGGGRGMMAFGGRQGQRGGDQGGPQAQRRQFPGQENRQPSAVEKARENLSTTLENQSASAEQIKQSLTALRSAQEKANQELATAQQDLRQILTVRQEAVCVLRGILR